MEWRYENDNTINKEKEKREKKKSLVLWFPVGITFGSAHRSGFSTWRVLGYQLFGRSQGTGRTLSGDVYFYGNNLGS